MKYASTKRVCTIFLAVKVIASILMMFPLSHKICRPFGVVSPYLVMAMAFDDINKQLLLSLLLWSALSIVVFIISLILLLISRFCKKLKVHFVKIILAIFFLGEAAAFMISFVAGFSALGWFHSAGKILGILFNVSLVVMLLFLYQNRNTRKCNTKYSTDGSRPLKKS